MGIAGMSIILHKLLACVNIHFTDVIECKLVYCIKAKITNN